MEEYLCPYCNRKYYFSRLDASGFLYCEICREYLIKKKQITFKMIIAFISIFSIVFPFICILLISLNNFEIQKKENYQVKDLIYKLQLSNK